MEHTRDRIYIINTFKSSVGSTGKSIDERLRNIRLVQVFNISFLLLCIAGTFLSLELPMFGISGILNWEDMPVLIILSFTFLLHQFPALLYETKILKHLRVLYKKEDHPVNSQLNKEFIEFIGNCNKTKPQKNVTVLILLFMLAGTVQMIFEGFLLWNYLQLPYIFLSVFLLYQVYQNYIRLKESISETENSLH